jgi:hypothetical protein
VRFLAPGLRPGLPLENGLPRVAGIGGVSGPLDPAYFTRARVMVSLASIHEALGLWRAGVWNQPASAEDLSTDVSLGG